MVGELSPYLSLLQLEGKMIEYTDDFCLVIANNIVSAAKGMKMAPNAKVSSKQNVLIKVERWTDGCLAREIKQSSRFDDYIQKSV